MNNWRKRSMNYKKKLVISVIASITMILSGCQAVGDSVTLIEKPKLADKKQEDIKDVLDKLLPEGAEYATAANSIPKQSVFMEDIDNDGIQEAFTLYYDTKQNNSVHLMSLRAVNGKWNKIADTNTNYNYLDYFKLDDLDGDGIKEIVIGVGLKDGVTKNQLLIYTVEDMRLHNSVDTDYEWVHIDDFNGDNISDIILLKGDVTVKQTAELYGYDNQQLKLLSSLELNPDAYHENIISGNLADETKAVFIDSGIGAHSMLTEIIAFDGKQLIKVGDDYDGTLLKEYPLYSSDINEDEIIDVGGMYIPKGYEDAAFAEIPFIYTYNDYNIDGTKQIIEQRFSDDMHGFYITIPMVWYNKVTIKKLDNGVRLISDEDQKTLFEVKWSEVASYDGAGTKLGEIKNLILYTEVIDDTLISSDNFHLFAMDFD